MRSAIISAAAVLGAVQLANAQTYTSCNPTTNSSCPSDPALGKTITVDFTQGESDYFTYAEGTNLTYDSTNGAAFTIASEGQAPTISSKDYIFFGNVELVIQAAPGTGIVSSFVMQSDDLDEIDWEWLGGNTTTVETNYFGKGNTTTYNRAIYYDVSSPQTSFHTYTIDWTQERIVWSIDGTDVRTLEYTDALDGANYPQTPMLIKVGNWDGGASTEPEGTVEWAGGYTDFDDAPFIMYVKSIKITDYHTGATSYTYGDETGSYESIEVTEGDNSTSTSSESSSATKTSTKTGTATLSASTTATATGSDASSTSSADSTDSSSSASSTSSAAAASSSAAAANGAGSLKVPAKYGKIDLVVVGLGLVLGYMVM